MYTMSYSNNKKAETVYVFLLSILNNIINYGLTDVFKRLADEY